MITSDQCRALMVDCAVLPAAELADRLDEFYNEVEPGPAFVATLGVLGKFAPSDVLANMQHQALLDAGDDAIEPHIHGSEYEWNDREAEDYDRWVRTCERAETQAEQDWRATMMRFLLALLPTLETLPEAA